MKNLILLIVAVILFVMLCPIGLSYTIVYYIFNEKNKGYNYLYRCAFSIDVLGNCLFGELFEFLFAVKRGKTYFGSLTSVSSAIGELIFQKNINRFGKWFSKVLDFTFREKNHCMNAYIKEIIKA